MAYWTTSPEQIRSTILEYSDGSEAFDNRNLSYEEYTRGAEYPYLGNNDLQIPYPSESFSDTPIFGTTDPAFLSSLNYPPNPIFDTDSNWSSPTTVISPYYQTCSNH